MITIHQRDGSNLIELKIIMSAQYRKYYTINTKIKVSKNPEESWVVACCHFGYAECNIRDYEAHILLEISRSPNYFTYLTLPYLTLPNLSHPHPYPYPYPYLLPASDRSSLQLDENTHVFLRKWLASFCFPTRPIRSTYPTRLASSMWHWSNITSLRPLSEGIGSTDPKSHLWLRIYNASWPCVMFWSIRLCAIEG